MEHRIAAGVTARAALGLSLVLTALPSAVVAQDRLKTMPGYDQYSRVAPQIPASVKPGALQTFWIDSGKAFEYQRDGKWYRFDVGSADEVGRSEGVNQRPRIRPTASTRRTTATATCG